MEFEGKVLFATGGGSGIAAATARRFAAGGGRVAVVDLDGSRANEIAADIDGAIGLGCDVADEALGSFRGGGHSRPVRAASTASSTPPDMLCSVRSRSGPWRTGTG